MNKKTSKPRYVPEKYRLGPKMRILEKHEMHRVRPDAFEPHNIKVRVTMYLDSDVVEFFKELSEKGPRYQTRINAALREVMEKSNQTESEDLASNLRQAKGLIDAVLKKVS